MRRRDFLKLSATTTAGVVLFQACEISDWGDGSPKSEFKVQSPHDIAEDYLWGNDAWYATVNPDTGESAGIIVRVFEGRAKKVEGNPNHPLNRGVLNARGQAMLQDLYHPDRIREPMRLVGTRGSGNYEPIRWDDAINELVSTLQGAQADQTLAITAPLSGALKQVVDLFVTGVGGSRVAFQTLEQSAVREGARRVFGTEMLPKPDIANSRFVLSFGADWLHTWVSPLQLAQGYAGLRKHSADSPRGDVYHIESRLSGTGTSADKWVPVIPGTEGLLAMAIASAILEGGNASGADAFNAVMGGVTLPSPEDAAASTGVAPDVIREIAERFAGETPSVAFGGGSAAAHVNGTANMTAIYALNLLVGNVNQPGGLLLNSPLSGDLEPFNPDTPISAGDWQGIIDQLSGGQISTLLVHEANPVYGLPRKLDIQTAMRSVGKIISFSRYLDETSVMADLILPDHVPLESWGSAVPQMMPGYPTIGFMQPAVLRFYDTYSFPDVLLSAAEELGLADSMPWATFQDVVKAQSELLRNSGAGNIAGTQDAPTFWTELLQTGVWMNEDAEPAAAGGGEAAPTEIQPEYSGDEGEYPFYLVPYEAVALGAGEFSHLPWLQALPDPMTTAVWNSWVELNPETAEKMEVGTGDYVRVTSPAGEADVRVYVNRTTAPNVAAIPMGQGHDFFTRYAEGRGINVLDLVDTLTDRETGTLAWGATRVKLERLGHFEKLPVLEGTAEPESPEDYEIIRRTRTPGDDPAGE